MREGYRLCPYERGICCKDECSHSCSIYSHNMRSNHKTLPYFSEKDKNKEIYYYEGYNHDCPYCGHWLAPDEYGYVICSNEKCLALWALNNVHNNWSYERVKRKENMQNIKFIKCQNCKDYLEKITNNSNLYQCTNKICGFKWWVKQTDKGFKHFPYGLDEKKVLAEKVDKLKKESKLYRRFKKELHLDFVPESCCEGIDCLEDNEFCQRTGCPIVKLRNTIAKLEIKGHDDDDLKKYGKDTNDWMKQVKLKWDFISLNGIDNPDKDVMYKIVFFRKEKQRDTIIWEPFPRNRFPDEHKAREFLNKFIGESPGENSEDYYVGLVRRRKKKEKVIAG